MKQFFPLKIILALCLISILPAHAQYTSIPDANFEQFLIDQGIDSEATLDGQVLTNDIALVAALDVSTTGA